MKIAMSLLMAITLVVLAMPSRSAAQPPNDQGALAGLKGAKVIFDVRVDDAAKLAFNLRLFLETWQGISAGGVKPEMIVAFRGPGVRLLTGPVIDDESHALLRELKRKGVAFHVCGVAMRVFKADPAALVPEVDLVQNGFISLIGFQNRGYATIAIN